MPRDAGALFVESLSPWTLWPGRTTPEYSVMEKLPSLTLDRFPFPLPQCHELEFTAFITQATIPCLPGQTGNFSATATPTRPATSMPFQNTLNPEPKSKPGRKPSIARYTRGPTLTPDARSFDRWSHHHITESHSAFRESWFYPPDSRPAAKVLVYNIPPMISPVPAGEKRSQAKGYGANPSVRVMQRVA